MIDLDELEINTESTGLYCQFGALLSAGRINYQTWDTIVRSLGIHKYILPDERTLNETLLDTIYMMHKKSATMLMWHALIMGHIESHYTETEQQKILGILIHFSIPRLKNRPKTVVQLS